jgi:hypothetical protein
MTSAGELSQFLLNDSSSPGVVALGNYLLHYCDEAAPVTSQVLDQFFRRALSFNFWRERQLQLSSTVEKALSETISALSVEPYMASAQLQVIEIARMTDLKEMLTRYLEGQIEEGRQFRMLSLPGQRVLALMLLPSGVLRVSLFTNLATLRAGKIVPLLDDMHLVYSPSLEIAADQVYHIEVANSVCCRFTVNHNGYSGYFIRGYTFQRFEPFDGGPLNTNPNLFYPLRRLEQFFVSRDTDPFYQYITQSIEKAAVLLRQGDPEGVGFARNTIEEAQTAHELIFVEDKLLGLLIRDLTRMLPDLKSPVGAQWVDSPLD